MEFLLIIHVFLKLKHSIQNETEYLEYSYVLNNFVSLRANFLDKFDY